MEIKSLLMKQAKVNRGVTNGKSTTSINFHVRDFKRERLTLSLAIYNGSIYLRLATVLTKTSLAFKLSSDMRRNAICAHTKFISVTVPFILTFTTSTQRTLRHCIHYYINILYTGCIKKNGVHLLCQIISKLLKLIAQFWTCFKPRSFLFRTSRNSCFYSQ